jgi:outer membrane protein insertion porin family
LATCFSAATVLAQAEFEGSKIESIDIVVDGTPQTQGVGETYLRIIRENIGDTYATVRIRDSIEQLFRQGDVANVEVSAVRKGDAGVGLTFSVKRKPRAKRVSIEIDPASDAKITEQELLFRLNLLDPGAVISEGSLDSNATAIQEYLRDRGYLRARVTYEQETLAPNEVAVKYNVAPGEPARIESLTVNIDGFNAAEITKDLKLQPGEVYTRELLNGDIERVRTALIKEGFLAPTLTPVEPIYDSEKNTMTINFTGNAGPKVDVIVESEKKELGESTKRRLLPIVREGTLDFAAIIEGERRLENYYQEKGYFFAQVTAVCSVEPLTPPGTPPASTGTEAACSSLSSEDFKDRKAVVRYVVKLDRRLRLDEIRLRGTSLFTIDDIYTVLESQRANLLGIIPLFGYGRGYTSERILEADTATIRSLLRELGYRDATVRANQGVSPNGENLIITFEVDEGLPTKVSDVEIRGNTAFSTPELEALLPPLEGQNYSRAKVRNGQKRIAEFYSTRGYYDAVVDFSVDEEAATAPGQQREFKVIYTIRNEGKPVYIARILVTGNERTKEQSIRRALAFKSGELLTASDVYLSEQNLYESDAFSLVEIKPQPAGERPDGSRNVDVIVNVVEQAPRLLTYGGGFSTDVGGNGFVDFRHFNFMGRLWQAGGRVSMSQQQQIVQLDFVDPRFLREKSNSFAPLRVSAQYKRDSTVKRIFRSAFDRGTFGIVQRVDQDGNPIDEFGAPAGDPTLNRLTFFAETNRTISRANRSILYVRYRFEDVRLFNIGSLLIKDLLVPDSRIRISGFGATFVRDTRKNCSARYSILDIIARGEPLEPCRYNATDPTNGDYLTAEYNVSVPALGANVGFHKFQASYNFYRTFPKFRNTTIAARGILGLASVFKENNRFGPPDFPGLEKILPISERFFAGGANTLRGFEFESAGPRVVITPQGTFHNSSGDVIVLPPFTIPFGGNALAVVNIEARMPVSKSIRLVPFYDGGNVFRKVGDIFNPPDVPVTDTFQRNLIVRWSHTVGLGLRVKTPVGGEFGVDYGYLLNPPTFLIPQTMGPPANLQLSPSKFHFRFSQAF